MKRDSRMYALAFALSMTVIAFTLPDNIRAAIDAIRVKGRFLLATKTPAPPLPLPCYQDTITPTTFTVYRKTGSNTVQGVPASSIIVQREQPASEFATLANGNTDLNGQASFVGVIFGRMNERQRVLAINAEGTDTTIINILSCSGVTDIRVPVKAP